MFSHDDFTNVLERLTCWPSKDVVRRRSLVSGLTNSYRVDNFGNTLAMTIYFFLKMFKIWWRFRKWKKKHRKCVLFLRLYQFNRERDILTLWNIILVIASPCVNKHPYDFQLQSGRCFPNHFTSEWWKNMIKVLSWRFHKSLGTLNMLNLEECSDNAIFSEWSNQVLDSP